MSTEQRGAHRIGGDQTVGSGPTIPAGSDTIPPQRRLGCWLGCAGYQHDPDCPLETVKAKPLPDLPCALDYRCKTLSISVLADPAYPTCPCSEAIAAHDMSGAL